jgi:hypothetical protein
MESCGLFFWLQSFGIDGNPDTNPWMLFPFQRCVLVPARMLPWAIYGFAKMFSKQTISAKNITS